MSLVHLSISQAATWMDGWNCHVRGSVCVCVWPSWRASVAPASLHPSPYQAMEAVQRGGGAPCTHTTHPHMREGEFQLSTKQGMTGVNGFLVDATRLGVFLVRPGSVVGWVGYTMLRWPLCWRNASFFHLASLSSLTSMAKGDRQEHKTHQLPDCSRATLRSPSASVFTVDRQTAVRTTQRIVGKDFARSHLTYRWA